MLPEPKGRPYYIDEDRPFAQRKDGMSLDIIRPKDVPRGRVPFVKDYTRSLMTEDLLRARPTFDHLKYLNKPDLSTGCTEPGYAGAHTGTYYPPMDRKPRDLSLTVADIEYAQPKKSRQKGHRHSDPVCPVYEMPSSVYLPEPLPCGPRGRFRTNDCTDIEQSQPRVLHPERNYARNPNEGRDIEFACPNYKDRIIRERRHRADRSLDVKDINDIKKAAPRDTNPLDPVYKVSANRVATSLHARFKEEHAVGTGPPPVEPLEVGNIPGSKPRKLQWDNGEPDLSLLREDIAGTVPQRWVGSVPHNIYDPPEVRAMISFHDPADIPGAQVGTLKKCSITTQRVVNPLNPRYPLLDGSTVPPSAPVIEAERGGSSRPTHPLLQARSIATSLPDIRAGPPTTPSQLGLQRDASAGTLRRPQASAPRLQPLSGGTSPAGGAAGFLAGQEADL